jgi:hypothetical protein
MLRKGGRFPVYTSCANSVAVMAAWLKRWAQEEAFCVEMPRLMSKEAL